MERSEQDTELEAALIEAYRETHYEVEEGSPMTLRVGEPSVALQQLLRGGGHRGAAYVTACNPRSEPLPEVENAERCAALREELEARGWSCMAGRGRHPSGGWDPEASLLVLGIGRGEAMEIGLRWGQNAVLWAGPDGSPTLILLR